MRELMTHIMEADLLNPEEKWFEERTNRHIGLVQAAAKKIAASGIVDGSALMAQVANHDASKLVEPERTPYIAISWRHKLEDAKGGYDPINAKGYQTPGMLSKEEENQAALHHVTTNSHHPESHVPPQEKGKIIDATSMPDIDIAEMVADWQAMAEELKKNTARQWFEKQVDVRWHFSDVQVALIDKLLRVFENTNEQEIFKPASQDELSTRQAEGEIRQRKEMYARAEKLLPGCVAKLKAHYKDDAVVEAAIAYADTEEVEKILKDLPRPIPTDRSSRAQIEGSIRNLDWPGVWTNGLTFLKQAAIIGSYNVFDTEIAQSIFNDFEFKQFRLARESSVALYIQPMTEADIEEYDAGQDELSVENGVARLWWD